MATWYHISRTSEGIHRIYEEGPFIGMQLRSKTHDGKVVVKPPYIYGEPTTPLPNVVEFLRQYWGQHIPSSLRGSKVQVESWVNWLNEQYKLGKIVRSDTGTYIYLNNDQATATSNQ